MPIKCHLCHNPILVRELRRISWSSGSPQKCCFNTDALVLFLFPSWSRKGCSGAAAERWRWGCSRIFGPQPLQYWWIGSGTHQRDVAWRTLCWVGLTRYSGSDWSALRAVLRQRYNRKSLQEVAQAWFILSVLSQSYSQHDSKDLKEKEEKGKRWEG